jgi:arsenate-mycothiol transferase
MVPVAWKMTRRPISTAWSAQALTELGIDISDHHPTQLGDTLIHAADLIVIVGTQAQLEPTDTPIETWETVEPSQRGIDGIDGMRLIRDDIAAHVNNLAARLTDHPDRPHHKTQPYK